MVGRGASVPASNVQRLSGEHPRGHPALAQREGLPISGSSVQIRRSVTLWRGRRVGGSDGDEGGFSRTSLPNRPAPCGMDPTFFLRTWWMSMSCSTRLVVKGGWRWQDAVGDGEEDYRATLTEAVAVDVKPAKSAADGTRCSHRSCDSSAIAFLRELVDFFAVTGTNRGEEVGTLNMGASARWLARPPVPVHLCGSHSPS